MTDAKPTDMGQTNDREDFMRMLRSMDGMLFLVCRLFTDRQRDHISDLYQEIV